MYEYLPLIFGFLSLCAIEIILGIDNVLFISIAASKLPKEKRRKVRIIGLGLALIFRIAFLFSITWLTTLTRDVITFSSFLGLDLMLSWRDIILIAGGSFLIVKASKEIFSLDEEKHAPTVKGVSSIAIILQIAVLDVVFSIDSVLTAIGLVENVWIMVAAIVVAIIVMLISAEGVSQFIEKYPSLKTLGLCFLVLIGVFLTADGFGLHIHKGYIYWAMGFSSIVIILNIRQKERELARTEKIHAEAESME
ncbi:MAG: TerC family protein [Rhodobacteraceae bacterium]|nr:TerC family protein [Paracoccaceae bacterium]